MYSYTTIRLIKENDILPICFEVSYEEEKKGKVKNITLQEYLQFINLKIKLKEIYIVFPISGFSSNYSDPVCLPVNPGLVKFV